MRFDLSRIERNSVFTISLRGRESLFGTLARCWDATMCMGFASQM